MSLIATPPFKGRIAKVKTFKNATLATLETDVNDWLAAAGESTILQLTYYVITGPEYSVMIVYTEG